MPERTPAYPHHPSSTQATAVIVGVKATPKYPYPSHKVWVHKLGQMLDIGSSQHLSQPCTSLVSPTHPYPPTSTLETDSRLNSQWNLPKHVTELGGTNWDTHLARAAVNISPMAAPPFTLTLPPAPVQFPHPNPLNMTLDCESRHTHHGISPTVSVDETGRTASIFPPSSLHPNLFTAHHTPPSIPPPTPLKPTSSVSTGLPNLIVFPLSCIYGGQKARKRDGGNLMNKRDGVCSLQNKVGKLLSREPWSQRYQLACIITKVDGVIAGLFSMSPTTDNILFKVHQDVQSAEMKFPSFPAWHMSLFVSFNSGFPLHFLLLIQQVQSLRFGESSSSVPADGYADGFFFTHTRGN